MVLHVRQTPPRTLPPPTKPTVPLITPLLSTILSLTTTAKTQLKFETIQATHRRKARRLQRVIRKSKILYAHRRIRRQTRNRRREMREEHREDILDAKYRRYMVLTRNRLSLEQIREERDKRREELLAEGALTRQEGESLGECEERWHEINQSFRVLWDKHKAGAILSEPRYLEGWPVRDMVTRPVIHWDWKYKDVKRKACLQCKAKKLPCSLTKWRFDPSKEEEEGTPACTRCVRNGQQHACMSRKKKQQEGEGGKLTWLFKARDVDPKKYSEAVRKYEVVSEELNTEMAEIGKEWMDVREGMVVDIIGGRMQELKLGNFVLPKHKKQVRRRKAW